MKRSRGSRSIRQWVQTSQATLRETPFVSRLTAQLVHVGLLDTAARLAAQTFLTAVPVFIVIAAFAPAPIRNSLLDSLRAVLGLSGPALDEVKHVFTTTGGKTLSLDTFGVVGIVVTVLSATACSRVLQRLCERSWHVPHAAARVAAWRWLVWLLVWLAALLLQGKIHEAFGAGRVLGTVLAVLLGTLLWWWTQHMLLAGRIPWLPLLPGALFTGGALVALARVSKIYVPRSLDRSIAQFGPFGLVFTLFSWLIVLFTAITACVATGYVVANEGPLIRLLGTPRTGEPGPVRGT